VVKKIADLYLDTRRTFAQHEDQQTASLLARNLLCHVTGENYESLMAKREMYASQETCQAMDYAVDRVVRGEPLAYVLGEWDFYGMSLYVDSNVLIPRDDTCAVTSLAIKQALYLDVSPRILDLCTGSGCIGLAVASHVKDARVTLADISPEAMAVAKKNIQRHKLGGRVSCVCVDALSTPPSFIGKFDMIVSNPPYVTTDEMEALDASVKEFEPHLALHGGTDGLDFYRAIVRNFSAALKPQGYMCLEFGMGQGDDVCKILEENQYNILDRTMDYNNRERAVLAQYSRKDDQNGY